VFAKADSPLLSRRAGVAEALGVAGLGPELFLECLTEAADVWAKRFSSEFNAEWLIYVLAELYKSRRYKSVVDRLKRLHIFPSGNKLISLEDEAGNKLPVFQVRLALSALLRHACAVALVEGLCACLSTDSALIQLQVHSTRADPHHGHQSLPAHHVLLSRTLRPEFCHALAQSQDASNMASLLGVTNMKALRFMTDYLIPSLGDETTEIPSLLSGLAFLKQQMAYMASKDQEALLKGLVFHLSFHIHTYIHACMHTCIYTYIHTYIYIIISLTTIPVSLLQPSTIQ
jgi:hypothetical protein